MDKLGGNLRDNILVIEERYSWDSSTDGTQFYRLPDSALSSLC